MVLWAVLVHLTRLLGRYCTDVVETALCSVCSLASTIWGGMSSSSSGFGGVAATALTSRSGMVSFAVLSQTPSEKSIISLYLPYAQACQSEAQSY